jgi:hypothetical protein
MAKAGMRKKPAFPKRLPRPQKINFSASSEEMKAIERKQFFTKMAEFNRAVEAEKQRHAHIAQIANQKIRDGSLTPQMAYEYAVAHVR